MFELLFNGTIILAQTIIIAIADRNPGSAAKLRKLSLSLSLCNVVLMMVTGVRRWNVFELFVKWDHHITMVYNKWSELSLH